MSYRRICRWGPKFSLRKINLQMMQRLFNNYARGHLDFDVAGSIRGSQKRVEPEALSLLKLFRCPRFPMNDLVPKVVSLELELTCSVSERPPIVGYRSRFSRQREQVHHAAEESGRLMLDSSNELAILGRWQMLGQHRPERGA